MGFGISGAVQGLAGTRLTDAGKSETGYFPSNLLAPRGIVFADDYAQPGFTDDQTLQAAINATSSTGTYPGWLIQLSARTYTLINPLTGTQYTHLQGVPRQSIITGNFANPLLTISNASGTAAAYEQAFSCEGVTFKLGLLSTAGLNLVGTTYAFPGSLSAKPYIRNCFFDVSVQPTAPALQVIYLGFVTVTDCVFSAGSVTISSSSGPTGIALLGTTCAQITNNSFYGLKIGISEAAYSSSPPQGSSLSNNIVSVCAYGYQGSGFQTTLISNCTFDPCIYPIALTNPGGIFVSNCDISTNFGTSTSNCVTIDCTGTGTGACYFENNVFNQYGTLASQDSVAIGQASSHGMAGIVFVNNYFGGSPSARYGINIKYVSDGVFSNNYFGNIFTKAINYDTATFAGGATSYYAIRGNICAGAVVGANPYGTLSGFTALATVGTGVAYFNPFPYDAWVSITGGTVTAVNIQGNGVNPATGGYLVLAGSYITVTFTGTPVWTWTGL